MKNVYFESIPPEARPTAPHYIPNLAPAPDPLPPPSEIDRPVHYQSNTGFECITAIEAAVEGLPPFEAYCIGNAFKYLWRHNEKGGSQDLEKAHWYIDRVIVERNNRGAK